MSDKVVNQWEELLSAEDTDYVNVDVGNKSVRLGSLNALELVEWIERQSDEEKKKTNGLWLVAKCLVNDTGQRIGKMDEVVKLREKALKTIKALVKAALALNGLEAKKGPNEPSETKSGDSPTDSPSPSE